MPLAFGATRRLRFGKIFPVIWIGNNPANVRLSPGPVDQLAGAFLWRSIVAAEAPVAAFWRGGRQPKKGHVTTGGGVRYLPRLRHL
jgi:hypothetical protein